MPTEVFVWESYSCNNSSDYRLVAEFATPAKADAMRAELTTFFKSHAKEQDKRPYESGKGPGGPTDVARAFGKKHGHDWKNFLVWGDEGLSGAEPTATTLDRSLVVYHSYCGGFGPDLHQVLTKAGGKLVTKGDEVGPPTLYASFATGPATEKLVRDLTTFFDQRLAPTGTLSHWTHPSWAPDQLEGDDANVAFVADGARCTFALPLLPSNIAPLRRHLERGKAKDLELRIAIKDDLRALKAAEKKAATMAKKSGAPARPVLEQTAAASKAPKDRLALHTIFPLSPKVNGADNILVTDRGVIAFAGETGKTQRLVTTDMKKRAMSWVSSPKAWLQGVIVDDDGTWLAGGEDGKLYASTNDGVSWKEHPAPGLATAIGKFRVWCLVRFEGALWATSKGGVARVIDGKWKRVDVPAKVRAKKRSEFWDNTRALPTLVVCDGVLYVLGEGIARWDGKKLVVEHAPGHDVRSLTQTEKGTLLAVGERKLDAQKIVIARPVWRKPRGGKWTLVPASALDHAEMPASERERDECETFIAIIAVGNYLVLVSDAELYFTRHAVRISTDDGVTWKRQKPTAGTSTRPTCAVPDGRGGVLIAGSQGLLMRVARGTWASASTGKKKATTAATSPAKAASRTPGRAPRRFELIGGGSSKFWEIALSGSHVTVRFGKIGTNGQTSVKDLGSPEKAKKEHDKLVAEKTKKGYRAR